jgi:hypothetical protein
MDIKIFKIQILEGYAWFVWFGREIVKREIDKREYEKRERDEKYSRFNVLFGIRE